MSQGNPFYQRYPRDEFADTGHLTCEEYGLFQRLRDWSWHHEGIPDSKDSFKRLARMFQLSRYKFEKLWKEVEKNFTLFEGFFTYEPDERKRLKLVDITAKRKRSGELGAESRWSTRNQPPEIGMANGMANAMANQDGKPMAYHHQNQSQIKQEERDHHHPLPPLAEVSEPDQGGGGGGSPPLLNQDFEMGHQEVRTDHEVINQRAEELGMPHLLSKTVAKKIRQKFPRGWSQQQITESLVRFPGQVSPSAWAGLELPQLLAEAKRQSSTDSRIGPSTAEPRNRKMTIEERIRASR